MKKLIFICLLVIFVQLFPTNPVNSHLLNFQQINESEIILSFHLDEYETMQINSSGENRVLFTHPQARGLNAEGLSELPVFNWVIEVPPAGNVNLEIISSKQKVLTGVLLAEHQTKQSSGQIVQTYDPAIMRGRRLVPLIVSPLQYDSRHGNLTMFTDIEIKLTTTGDGGKNCLNSERKLSRSFEPLYQAEVLNYQEMRQREDYQKPALLIICPDDNTVLENLAYLVDWKRQKGFEVTLATTAETGETYAEIKEYLQNAYDTWENPPEYICLAGDADGNYAIPPCFETISMYNAYGDHQYGQLEGDDILLDAHIGRLSYNNIMQLQVLISKILYYEKSPTQQGTEWFEKSLLIGDPTHSGQSTINTCLVVKEMMLDYPGNWFEDDDFYEVYNSPFPTQMVEAVEAGCLYMFYRGYLGTSGWNPGLEDNSFMLPFASIITCGTGNYYQGDAKSEIFTRMGTPSNLEGAIGMVGEATSGNHTCFNNAITLGIASGIFQHDIFSMGGALTMGKHYLWSLYPQNPDYYVDIVSIWNNLMGDPSLELWTDVPSELSVEYSAEIAIGENLWQVSVEDAGGFAEGAWVTLSAPDPEDFAVTEYCDQLGEALIPVSDLEEGDYLLTVSKHDYLPWIDTVSVVQADQFVDIAEIEYIEISGNGDDSLNPGEEFDLDVTLINHGTQPVYGVNAHLTTTNEYLTVTIPLLEFEDIPAGGTANPVDNFRICISPSALDGIEPVLHFSITDEDEQEWQSWEIPVITGASLWLESFTIGENDVLHPGETDEMYCTISNNGSITVEDVTARIYCLDQYFTLEDDLIYLGDIAPGETIENHADFFAITAPEYILPGIQETFYLEFTNPQGFSNTISTIIPVGIADINDPMGPDNFGYCCFDDEDTQYDYCPEYDWIEINPDYGGEGIELDLYSNHGYGEIEIIDLPEDFHFNFYGESYQKLTVCSNGWVAPGIEYSATWMNWYLPSPQGPSPMIAIFWDDLEIHNVLSGVYWQYFENEHYLVIEWSHALNDNQDEEVTFEVILYDYEYYPTILDVSQIKMQYKVMNNTHVGAYPSDHGQYATVGLENCDSTIGLQYTFFNEYALTNKPLEDEMAILFTPYIYDELAYLRIIDEIVLAGDDIFMESGETVELNLEVQNTGATAAENIDLEISTDDPFIEILQSTSAIESLSPGQSSLLDNAFTFYIPPETPDFHNFPLYVNITSDQFSTIRVLPFISYQPNTLSTDQDSLYVELEMGQSETRTFELANIGEQSVNFYINAEQTYPPRRDLSDAYAFCEENYFTPGETTDWTIGIFNGSTDEWITDLDLDFPYEVTVNSATDATGGSGGDLVWNGTTGTGANINWHGVTPYELGVVQSGDHAYLDINVTISESIAGNLHIPWTLTGDQYGAEPHTSSGEFILHSPLQWISLDTSSGTLDPDESIEITMNFDTSDIPAGLHSALITITSDSWDTKFITVDLNVISNDNNGEELPEYSQLLGNYPNPFNPETTIKFYTTEGTENTEINIYNIKGQLVRELRIKNEGLRINSVVWDGKDSQDRSCASGIYFCRIKAGLQVKTQKMLLLK